MKYLSVCSGIEAASVAWHPLGWEPLAFSEIEAFPRAVLAHHYPDVECFGDFTKLRDEQFIGNADVLVGGTPCQAFSVAGLRNSLSDERGNLSLEFVRLADAIDDLRSAAGRQPAIIVWENVPGVLSVKDNAFGCFLAALAGDVTPIDPPRGKWSNAGVVDGPQRSVAWRILDAQYFGLAQRRRRVFVVASARKGFDPAAVLLEFEGVRRDTPPRREAGQVAPTIPSRSTAGGGLGTDFDCDGGVITLAHGQGGAEVARERSPTLTCVHEAPIAAIPVTHSLRAEGFDASEDGTGRGTPLVPVAIPMQEVGKRTGASTTDPRAGIGIGEDGDPMYTLQAGAQHGVATYGVSGELVVDEESIGPLDTTSQRGQGMVAAYAFQPRIARNGRGDMGDVVNALNAQSGETGKGDAAPCVAFAFHENQRAEVTINDTAGSLKVGGGKPGQGYPAVMQHMAVRRLTPVECERLQGFPDGYTNIPWRKQPTAPDGPRYKALGNSMAVPCMRWIGTRIARQLGGKI
jgi:DNA (cytosine-5)-methyltransferase 1